jgi:transmembrane sensor
MNDNLQHIDFELLTRFLAGETSQAESQIVTDWENASEENRMELNSLRQAWNLMDSTSSHSNINIEEEWEVHQKKFIEKEAGKIIPLRRILNIAAAILIGLGIISYVVKFTSTKTIKTQIAQTREFVLPDGSKVTLNAQSKLSYKKDYNHTIREVHLKGEGFFEVAKNPEKPFIIHVENAEIKVLGTSFNVRAYRNMDKIEVTVKEGTVSVRDNKIESKKVIITAGDRADFDKKSDTIEKQVNSDRNYISWKTREIVFENDSLSTIIQTLENVYHRNIVLGNPELGKCTVSTTFNNKEFSTVIEVLETTLDIKFNQEGKKFVIKGKGC